MNTIDIRKNLFLCPVVFDDDPCDERGMALPIDDREIHFTVNASRMIKEGSKLVLNDSIPKDYVPAKEITSGIMHFRTIMGPEHKTYLPLFISYRMLTALFGKDVRIAVVSFEDAKGLCLYETNIEGIVVGPGEMNRVILKDELGDAGQA